MNDVSVPPTSFSSNSEAVITLLTVSITLIQDFICHMHNNYMGAVVGNEILKSQAPSNNVQKYV